MFAVFYASVTDDDGVFVDGPFFGGLTEEKETAELLAHDLANDKKLPGSTIPRVWPCDTLHDIEQLVRKQHNIMAVEIYDTCDTQARNRIIRRKS